MTVQFREARGRYLKDMMIEIKTERDIERAFGIGVMSVAVHLGY